MRHAREPVEAGAEPPARVAVRAPARHRRPRGRGGRHEVEGSSLKIAMVMFAWLTAMTVVSVALVSGLTHRTRAASVASTALADPDAGRSGQGDEASRSEHRAAAALAPSPSAPPPAPSAPPPATPASPEVAAGSAAQAVTPSAPAPAPSPTRPAPVAGLNQVQMDNAGRIVAVGRQMQLPRWAHVIAIATALQESNLRNLANRAVPGSLTLPHEGIGSDHDSVGLFQQRVSAGWGSVSQLMSPEYAATRFYAKLVLVPGWRNLSVTVAAQAVQRSAFPGAYAKHEGRANQIVDGLG